MKLTLVALGSLAVVAGSIALAADSDWPQFRGASANGTGSGSPPVEWNGESGKNILWRAEIPGWGV